ncbi:LysR substrate-binding domain-containing protein [Sphingomonas aerolata]|uniref:LysR substrate-binding domain-containing protein n=1 Tax=Sphingomonas aerolata TaxID=185951 RepID=UPI0035A58BBE
MDKLAALRAFVQAADTRSFVEAGRQLGLSASAIGKAIARLEESLGLRLFHRNTRSMALTEEGAAYLDRCRDILINLDEAEAGLRASGTNPSGILRVSLPIVGMLLMPAISSFMTAYPEIRLDIDFTDRLVDVIEEGFDVVIRTGDGGDSRLMSRRTGSFRHHIVASPAYLAQRGTPVVPQDLMEHACLHHRYPSTGKFERWPIETDGIAIDLALPVRASASTIEPLIEMAEGGFGIASLPDFAVARSVRAGSLAIILAQHVAVRGVFKALWPSSRHVAPKVRVFVDHMAANLFG